MSIRRSGAALSLALIAGLLAPAAAQASLPPEGSGLSQLRQDTVDRARAALNNPRSYRLAVDGTIYKSTPSGSYNYLGRDGSNKNINQYTGNRSEEWCGDFAAAMWTGVNKPNASDYPRIPTSYPSSQAWATDVGDRFRAFSASRTRMPSPGDVLVWTNDDASTGGHVGVVVSVDYSGDTVTTIEGNAAAGGNHDSIARFTYAWDSNGPTKSGKWFRGFAERE